MRCRIEPSIGLLSKIQRKKLDSGFDVAKTKLDTHSGQGPFVIASNASQAMFDAWDDDGKAAWGIAYNALTQTILMYGDPGTVHARVSGYISQQIVLKLCSLSNVLAGLISESTFAEKQSQSQDVVDGCQPWGRTTMYTAQGAKSPDASYYVGKVSCGRSVVIKIAHRNESFAALREEIAWWHNANVGLVLGVFIDVRSDITDANLILLSHSRESCVMAQKRFGYTSGCNAVGLPGFQLHIPVRLLSGSGSQDLQDNCISIDLYKLQQMIISPGYEMTDN